MTPGRSTAEVHDRYLAALLGGREREAFDLLDGALDDGISAPLVYLEVVEAALREVGERWARAEVSIAEEHLATAVVVANLARLAPRLRPSAAPGGSGGLIVVAASPGDLHSVGARMLADSFDAAGWEVHYLPPPTPTGVLLPHVESVRPEVVALSTTIPTHLPGLIEAVAAILDLPAPPLIALGGRAYRSDPDLPFRLGGDVSAPDAFAAVVAVTAVLAARGAGARQPVEPGGPPPPP